MLVLSTRVKIYIICGFVFCILPVKILKETHWYLKSIYGKVSVKMAPSYSTGPFHRCVMNVPLLRLQWGDGVAASNSF